MPSAELARYLQARADGAGMMSACVRSGISLSEARLVELDISKGELALPEPSKEEPIMARKAKTESEEAIVAEILKPDFERAIRVLNHDVKPAEENNASSRGDLSAAWKIIEDECHCNKAATKVFNKLLTMSDEKRDDYLRTLYGLMQTAHIGISSDLVDRMQADGEAPRMPTVDAPREGLATLQPELTH